MSLDLDYVQTWIVVLSGCASLITVAGSLWLKFKAEARVLDAQKVESDIKLLKLFTEVMEIAHSRVASGHSDKLLSVALSDPSISKAVLDKKITVGELAELSRIVGVASQDAAIAAVAELGHRHVTLRTAAIRGLESLATFKKDVAEPYLKLLRLEKSWARV